MRVRMMRVMLMVVRTNVEKALTLPLAQVATPQVVVDDASGERLRNRRTIPQLEMYGGNFSRYGGDLVRSPRACVVGLSSWLHLCSAR